MRSTSPAATFSPSSGSVKSVANVKLSTTEDAEDTEARLKLREGLCAFYVATVSRTVAETQTRYSPRGTGERSTHIVLRSSASSVVESFRYEIAGLTFSGLMLCVFSACS